MGLLFFFNEEWLQKKKKVDILEWPSQKNTENLSNDFKEVVPIFARKSGIELPNQDSYPERLSSVLLV